MENLGSAGLPSHKNGQKVSLADGSASFPEILTSEDFEFVLVNPTNDLSPGRYVIQNKNSRSVVRASRRVGHGFGYRTYLTHNCVMLRKCCANSSRRFGLKRKHVG